MLNVTVNKTAYTERMKEIILCSSICVSTITYLIIVLRVHRVVITIFVWS